jgi:hypothetical protein
MVERVPTLNALMGLLHDGEIELLDQVLPDTMERLEGHISVYEAGPTVTETGETLNAAEIAAPCD